MKLLSISFLILQGLAIIHGAQNEFPKRGNRARSTAPVDNIRQFLKQGMNQTGTVGMSIAIIYKGKLIFSEGYGRRNEHDPFTPETLAMIGSCTKAFTAAAVGELVAEGKVDWDTTPVSEYLPEFQLNDPYLNAQTTLADLLSHRSAVPELNYAWFYNTESRKSLVERTKYATAAPKLTPYTNYNNVAFAIGGLAAANAVGMEYEDLVREKVLKPLGLENTGFSSKEMSKHNNFAWPFVAYSFEEALQGRVQMINYTNMATASAPAGDIYSNVLDFARWGQTIMQNGVKDGKQVLNSTSLGTILSGQSIFTARNLNPDFPPTSTYGLGWALESYKGKIVFAHDGSVDSYSAFLALLPDSELVIAQLSNFQPSSLLGNSVFYIADQILGLPKTTDWAQQVISSTQALYEQYLPVPGSGLPPRIKNSPPSHKLNNYVGVYDNPVYGDLDIKLEKNGGSNKERLHMKMRVFEGKLDHYHFDSFNTTFGYSVIQTVQLVTFITGQDGSVAGVEFILDDPNNLVHFQKKA
ncbi:hypothetical protein BGZ49_005529 [Haplosporangium sp. Z 27]|nr:hypothetical protein BGZ49_005529 [Haplosporangium sp. Z 27]